MERCLLRESTVPRKRMISFLANTPAAAVNTFPPKGEINVEVGSTGTRGCCDASYCVERVVYLLGSGRGALYWT